MLNRIILMGRLVATPELRHTPNGVAVTSFTLAVGRDFVRSGEERATDFIDIVAWRQSAEFASKYFSKGQLVAVDGTLQTRTYQDKNGVSRKAFEVIADKLHFAEGKRDSSNFGSDFEATTSAAESSQENSKAGGEFQNEGLGYTELPSSDDDLPF